MYILRLSFLKSTAFACIFSQFILFSSKMHAFLIRNNGFVLLLRKLNSIEICQNHIGFYNFHNDIHREGILTKSVYIDHSYPIISIHHKSLALLLHQSPLFFDKKPRIKSQLQEVNLFPWVQYFVDLMRIRTCVYLTIIRET